MGTSFQSNSSLATGPVLAASIASAASFLVLRATELGLGTVFVAWIYRDKLKKILNIPENYVIPFVLPIGYLDENPDSKPRKDLEEIILTATKVEV